MTSGPNLTQRVSRLENDMESVYEILTELRTTQDGHTRTLDEHTRRLDSIDDTLVEHTGRFDRIDGTLEEILRRLPEPS